MTPLVVYRIKRIMGVLLIVFGVGLMMKGFLPKDNKINTLLEQVDKNNILLLLIVRWINVCHQFRRVYFY